MGDIDGAFGDAKEALTIAPHYPQVTLAVFNIIVNRTFY